MTKHNSNNDDAAGKNAAITRRTALRGLAATGAAVFGAGGGIKGFPAVWAQNIRDVELVHVGGVWSAIDAIAAQASKDLGFRVRMENAWADGLVTQILTRPESLDIVDMEYWMLKLTVPSGALRAVDTMRIANWDKLNPIFTKGKYWDGSPVSTQGVAPSGAMYLEQEMGNALAGEPTRWATNMPIIYNADTLGTRPDLIGNIGSWAELLNPAHKGRAALAGVPAVGIMDAAMAIEAAGLIRYGDKGNMTRDEIDRTIAILAEAKRNGQFRDFWATFEASVDLMASGETVIQSMWQPAIQAVRARGVAVDYPTLKEGYRAWGNGLGFMRHVDGLKLDAAYEYLNWYISGWQGAFIARSGYYSSLPETAQEFLEPYEWDYWYGGKPAARDILDPFGNVVDKAGHARDGGSFRQRLGHIACWNTLMDENDYLVRSWDALLSA
ncbi:MAG TPA: extracellular solute-binding protein [Aliiroseovarius sp.]|nr:extracellular solute-binding protein [Aliiroseovarius sp.]